MFRDRPSCIDEGTVRRSGRLSCQNSVLGIVTDYYFAVERGVLSYYEIEHHVLKGAYSLHSMEILPKKGKTKREKRTIRFFKYVNQIPLTVNNELFNRLVSTMGLFRTYVILIATTSIDRAEWIIALGSNIEYAHQHRLSIAAPQHDISFSVNDKSICGLEVDENEEENVDFHVEEHASDEDKNSIDEIISSAGAASAMKRFTHCFHPLIR